MNVGAMAHDVFLEQIRRFGKEVLPRLQAHQVKRVPAAETVRGVAARRTVAPGLAGWITRLALQRGACALVQVRA